MSTTPRKASRLKLLLGIAIPMLVIAITIVMAGMSFAWFSTDVNATVNSIYIGTQAVYDIGFTPANANNDPYMGQQAFKSQDKGGTLLTQFDYQSLLSNDLRLESPYYFVSSVTFDGTGDSGSTLKLSFEDVLISQMGTGTDVKDHYPSGVDEGIHTHTVEDIPYAFTWFFRKAPEADGRLKDATHTANSSDKYPLVTSEMTEREVWYTPYGVLNMYKSGDYAYAVDGKGSTTALTALPEQTDVTLEGVTNGTYEFYIIFAPEEMFWSQFVGAVGEKKSVDFNTVYGENDTTTAKEQIFGGESRPTNMMYYADPAYSGYKFHFTARLEVIGPTAAA